jgi:hypothetical protein
MIYERQKAMMLAEQIRGLIDFVQKTYENPNNLYLDKDKWFQIKLIIEDFKFSIIADELKRVNEYDWDGKYTYYLVDHFTKGFYIIDEYVNNHYDELFLLTARLHALRSQLVLFHKNE